jgi:hypothetical protein
MSLKRISLVGFFAIFAISCGLVANDPVGHPESQNVPNGTPAPRDAGAADDTPADTSVVSETPSVLPADPDASSCGACVDRMISWSLSGGLAASSTTYSVAPCAAFEVDVVPAGWLDPESLPKTCTGTLPRCHADAIRQGVADADVVAALAASHAGADEYVYGDDPRPADGAIAIVEVDGRRLSVGWGDCSNDSSANCVPLGLRRFVDLLLAISSESRKTMPCNL